MSAIERILEIPRRMIGAPREAISTPALIVDLPVVERNIAEMARRMKGLPAALRPHVKIHKSPALGQMQLDAGAIGLTTATIWEASTMLDAGLGDVLVANQVVGPVKAAELARIAGLGRVIVAVDSVANAVELSTAARKAGTEIHVLVEIDVGLHRSGVRAVDAAAEFARQLEKLPGLRLHGLLGYEGHCMLEPDRQTRIEKAKASNEILIAAADAFDRHGLPTQIIAAGGLGTWDITGANPRITEIHAGSYIFMDAFHRALVPGFEVGLTVLATVVSVTDDMAVIDCGRKSIGIDRAIPEVAGGLGEIRFEHGEFFIHEEHTVLTIAPGIRLRIGDHVELIPGYAPTTVNLYDIYFVVVEDMVVDVWPIVGRYGSVTAGVGPASAAPRA